MVYGLIEMLIGLILVGIGDIISISRPFSLIADSMVNLGAITCAVGLIVVSLEI